jgi:cytochrome c
MKMLTKLIVGVMAAVGIATGAWAQERANKDEAKTMAEQAAAYVAKVGPEQAFKEFSDKSNAKWKNKDLYVFAYNMKGDCVAHGANETLIGKNLIDLKDTNGKPIIKEMMTAVKPGSGTVDYAWAHPQTKNVEDKTSFVVKTANYDGFVGVGAYR